MLARFLLAVVLTTASATGLRAEEPGLSPTQLQAMRARMAQPDRMDRDGSTARERWVRAVLSSPDAMTGYAAGRCGPGLSRELYAHVYVATSGCSNSRQAWAAHPTLHGAPPGEPQVHVVNPRRTRLGSTDDMLYLPPRYFAWCPGGEYREVAAFGPGPVKACDDPTPPAQTLDFMRELQPRYMLSCPQARYERAEPGARLPIRCSAPGPQ